MKIQSTQDYDLFQRIAGNRAMSKPHIARLKEAIADDPSTTRYTPIIVNSNWEVIDGQHRLEALKALNLPVHYLKVEGADLGVVQRLNSVAKQWTPIDYAKSYRELGNENYKLYLDFQGEFHFNHDVLRKYMAGDKLVTGLGFKDGKFVVDDVARAYRLCKYLQEATDYYDRLKLRNQATGFYSIITSPNYDHKQMLKKLRLHAFRIHEQATAADYAREFERIFNYHSHGGPIRLF